MGTLIRAIAVVFVLTMQFSPLAAQTQPRQQEEFTPIDQLPPQEQLPAAPLLVGAYAFVLLMLFGYLVMVSRRLSAIQAEVNRLDADLKRAGKG
jgi:type VI protein secretion system component VasF